MQMKAGMVPKDCGFKHQFQQTFRLSEIFNKTRFNKIAIQGTPQMAVDREAIKFAFRESTRTIPSVTFPYFMCNPP